MNFSLFRYRVFTLTELLLFYTSWKCYCSSLSAPYCNRKLCFFASGSLSKYLNNSTSFVFLKPSLFLLIAQNRSCSESVYYLKNSGSLTFHACVTKSVGPQYICHEMRAQSDKFYYFTIGPDGHVHSLLLYGFELCTANM